MKIDNNIVAIVTGGASGLGEATVRLLASLGARVMIGDFNDDRGKEIAKELGGPEKVRFFLTDVTKEEQTKQLVEETVKAFGAVHVVVNSAGVGHAGLVVDAKGNVLGTDQMQRVLNINVVGTFNVCKYAALAMTKQQPIAGTPGERGVLINVASVAGIEGQKGQSIYSASKGAVIAMTLPLARDLGKFGIRVVTIAPGLIETPMGAAIPERVRQTLQRATAINRLGNPEEFAQCVTGLCTNSYITGETIRMDGGIRFPHL